MSLIAPAADGIGVPGEVGDAGYLGRLEHASVVATLGNLLTFPDIRGRVTAGEWVAVHGCGGVGLSAVQIANALGANVIAVDVSDQKLAVAKRSRARQNR